MTTITIDRALLEQALEALEYGQHSLKQVSEHQWESRGQLAMDALRAALAQEQPNPPGCDHCNHPLYAATKCRVCGRVTEPKTDPKPMSPEQRQRWEELAAMPQQAEPNAEYERGFIDGMQKQAQSSVDRAVNRMAEPVQEPVAWIHRQGNHWEVSERHLDEDERDRGWTEEPLYTTPPQRKPLTDEEIDRVWDQWFGAYGLRGSGGPYTRRGFARAIERAHGINHSKPE